MKYGTLVRIPEGGDLAAICDEKFAAITAIGLDSCQLVYKPAVYKMEDADIIRARADAHGVEISAQFCGFRDAYSQVWDTYFDYRIAGINNPKYGAERLNYLFSAIPFMKRLGITDMVIHAGFLPNDPFAPEYIDMVVSVRVLGGKLKAAGMNLLFETGPESPISLVRLIEDTGLDNLFINFDTGNLILYGFGNPVDAAYTFGKYVRNMHAKDALPPRDPRKLGTEVEIGTGFVDFDKTFSLLSEVGYDRYVTIEREISGGDQGASIASAMDYLKKIVKKYQ
ncbi:MAG: sugar phosphate isomerase/epimerase [Ruminococcaceae bacterium]|nr:sugar phosphate isomerase/epimerase [Oscillospiraceae bacterium]